jgi:hypothetical protein
MDEGGQPRTIDLTSALKTNGRASLAIAKLHNLK